MNNGLLICSFDIHFSTSEDLFDELLPSLSITVLLDRMQSGIDRCLDERRSRVD